MPDAFDMLGDAVTTDKGTIYDYDASLGEAFGGGAQRQYDTNPVALTARSLRTFSEDMNSIIGNTDRIDQKAAEEEVRSRGLDLKIPVGGITRYELDTLQYLKQREIRQNTVAARARGITGAAAGFAGGLAASFTDPVNVASGFIPFVGQYRYARWLSQAGTSTAARAGVRAAAGAVEGAAGAALIEPLVYAGATSQQLDYGLTDSFLNVTLGGVMGGGLHTIGGAVYDARVSRALRGLDEGLKGNTALLAQVELRDAAAAMPEHKQREIFQEAVAQVERGEPVDVTPAVARQVEMVSARTEPSQQVPTGVTFTTAKGSTYRVNEDGTTTRDKAYRPEHGEKEQGPQPQSERTFYVTPEEANKLGEFQTQGNGKKAVVQHENGQWGVRYEEGKDAGKFERRTMVTPKYEPAAGLMPVEIWKGGSRVHFGNEITEVRAAPMPKLHDLGSLIEQAKADRTESAFNRQFGDDADVAASRAADEAVAKSTDDMETVAEDVKFLDDQINGMKSRELWTKADDDAIAQGDEAAKAFEKEASIYRAAAVCMMEG